MGEGEHGTTPEANVHHEDGQPDDAQAAPDEEIAVDTESEMMQKIEELQTQADEYKDKYLRSVADFSNFRKRQDRERKQQAWRIHADVLRGLLDPLDDFRRALEHVPDGEIDSGWVQGIMLIEQKLLALLSKYNVTPIEAEGKVFDPNFHEAMFRTAPTNTGGHRQRGVQEEGYLMDDQVLRHGSQGLRARALQSRPSLQEAAPEVHGADAQSTPDSALQHV